MASCNGTRRHFTEAARLAAALARQRKREHRSQFPQDHMLIMVVVRTNAVPMGFGWQIRRFGQMQPIAQSRDDFADPVSAGRSGQVALEVLKTRLADDPSSGHQ